MKNHYPLRVGTQLGSIVSDVPTRTYLNETDEQSEIKHYGGHFVCESVATQTLAKQLVDAYNKVYGCTHADKPCIGWCLCCQWKISHHDWVDQDNKLKKDQPKEWTPEEVKEYMRTAPWHFKPDYNQVDVVKVIEDLVHVIKNRDTDTQTISIGHAVQNAEAALGMLQAFKEQRDNKPNYDSLEFHLGQNLRKKEDDEKIKSLIAFTEYKLKTKISWNNEHRIWQEHLQECGHIGPPLKNVSEPIEMPLKDGQPEKIDINNWSKTPFVQDEIEKRVAHILPFYPDINKVVAQAIVYACRQMVELKEEEKYD